MLFASDVSMPIMIARGPGAGGRGRGWGSWAAGRRRRPGAGSRGGICGLRRPLYELHASIIGSGECGIFAPSSPLSSFLCFHCVGVSFRSPETVNLLKIACMACRTGTPDNCMKGAKEGGAGTIAYQRPANLAVARRAQTELAAPVFVSGCFY